MKRLLTYALPIVMGISSLACAAPQDAAAAGSFTDTAKHWAAPAIGWAVDQHIVDGYEDATFRPDQAVSEPEFLAMLLRAYPEAKLPEAQNGASWYEPYYSFADAHRWPVIRSTDRAKYNRGEVARVIAASQKGTQLNVSDSVRFLLEQGLSQGKSAATVEGYEAADKLTRAEAVQFISNLKQKQFHLLPGQSPAGSGTVPATSAPPTEPASTKASVTVKGIAIGDSADTVIARLGQPARKDAAEYPGMTWYIYNQDYASYAQIGVSEGGKVVALYTPSSNWSTDRGIKDGSGKAEVTQSYGTPLKFILKGNTQFIINYGKSGGEYATYEADGAYVTFFYDLHKDQTVTGIQVVEKGTEQSLKAFYPKGSSELASAFERQSLDLANAHRVKLGLPAFVWDDAAAATARKHSQDMAAKGYFDHTNLQGLSPFDRMDRDGIEYRSAAENIAAGQQSAIQAHHGWMNSEGHRVNLLSDNQRLGVGVYFGGDMHIYYTQNFLSP
ncbi:CAP-associated domain-containing protein [Paenibacillus silviterrae]|uniref:CAP-associated domain-containing protein n=1 Tax=Paenibacillus silviterrae TaxID=3242194 RepID=UPI0025438D2D|nr:CAP-associated domain-containing protein [Paenibacillus chinjuensis]